MQPSPRETRVAKLNFTWVSILAHAIEEMKKTAPAVLDFLATVALQFSKRRKIKSPQCVWQMELWKGAQPYPESQLAFILGNGHLNTKVNVSRIMMTNMNQN